MSLFTYSAKDMAKLVGGGTGSHTYARRWFLMGRRQNIVLQVIINLIYAAIIAGIFIVIPVTSNASLLIRMPVIILGAALVLWLILQSIKLVNFLLGHGHQQADDKATLDQIMSEYRSNKQAGAKNEYH